MTASVHLQTGETVRYSGCRGVIELHEAKNRAYIPIGDVPKHLEAYSWRLLKPKSTNED